MAMLKFVPRFLEVDSDSYKETIDWLLREYKGKTIILAYEADPNQELDPADEQIYSLKKHNVKNPKDAVTEYNIGFGVKKAKGTPPDPNSN